MKMISFYKKNPGVALFFTNVFLFIIFIFIQDPFYIFSKTYENAPPILNLELSELQKIKIENKEKKLIYELKKIKQSSENIHKLEDWIQKTQWELTIIDEINEKKENYSVDKDNLKDFLDMILNLKRYYSLPKNSHNLSITGISDESSKIYFYTGSKEQQKEDILTIGYVSIRNHSSYVVLNLEDTIYQVEGNLKLKSGFEDKYYFRNHTIVSEIDKNKIDKIIVHSSRGRMIYARAGNDWQLLEPKPGKIQSSNFSGILDEIVTLKANQFFNKQLPADQEWENFKMTLEIHYSPSMGKLEKREIRFLGKKDYVKYLLQYQNQFYEVSAYRIEDLLEPEKLLEKEEK